MKSALKLVGYIVAFLLMAAGLVAIVLYIMGMGTDDFDIITTMPPAETATPAPTEPANTPEPTPTVTPFIEPTAEPTPSPTPSPSPTPVVTPDPIGVPLGSDKFSSDTGVYMNLEVLWSAETAEGGNAKVTVTVNLRSFRMNAPAGKKTLDIKLNDQVVTFDVPQLIIETEEEVVTELATHTFTVPAPKGEITSLDLDVLWRYGGQYSGQQLDEILAQGFVTMIH